MTIHLYPQPPLPLFTPKYDPSILNPIPTKPPLLNHDPSNLTSVAPIRNPHFSTTTLQCSTPSQPNPHFSTTTPQSSPPYPTPPPTPNSHLSKVYKPSTT
ncbi:hypothetical protein Pmani_021202 [Petrolisthes manimaculis]|uniref:Uncharacterized protein n=1 Tax=Petrolisthes manimaculis TaxID=1843537 RepID=A0AAE1U5I9_9EUCA|nr:hypothetical protein Pmani_021202 [Petrolisthes manimaculis]